MHKLIWTLVMSLTAAVAIAQESTIGNETSAAAQVKDETETAAAVEAEEEKEEFKPPAGFRAKKRGDTILYCIQDSTVGTRFKTEKCYDEAQMKDYLLAREQNSRDFDQRRSVCQNPRACGRP
ncbi:MAG: hypothetical protein WD944_05830 [Steroidobacteraceae bacterium]